MDTTNQRWMQLSISTAAVLVTGGIVLGPDLLPRTGENADHYSVPLPCSEEAEPHADTRKVIDSGHLPLFDAPWDYEVGHLSNNFCPPSVTHKMTDDGLGNKTITHTRTEGDIHTSETAFSVPDRYKVTVIDSDHPNGNPSPSPDPNIDLAKYPFLRAVVSAVKPGPDSTLENPTWVFADNKLWWVKAEMGRRPHPRRF